MCVYVGVLCVYLHHKKSFADFWATDHIMFIYSAGFGELSNIWRHQSVACLMKNILKGIAMEFLCRKGSHKQRLILTKNVILKLKRRNSTIPGKIEFILHSPS